MYFQHDIHYIINARAGRSNADEVVAELRKLAPGSAISLTRNERDLDLIFQKQEKAPKVFVAVGGDGTVRLIAERVWKSGQILGIIPRGSGNGLARELGLNKTMPILVSEIEQGRTIDLDVLSFNDHFGVNIGGLGFDAALTYFFNKRGVRGLWGYILAGIRTALNFKSISADLLFDDKTVRGDFQMIIFANSRQFGNNVRIAPKASPCDGYIEMVLVRPFPTILYPFFLFQLLRGRLRSSKFTEFIKTKGPVTINCKGARLQVDGDLIEFNDSLIVRIIPGALKVIASQPNFTGLQVK